MSVSRTPQVPALRRAFLALCVLSHFTWQVTFLKDQAAKRQTACWHIKEKERKEMFKTGMPAVSRHLISKQRHSELVGQVSSSARRAKINVPPEDSQSKAYYRPSDSGNSMRKSGDCACSSVLVAR